jgi:hypothetical protein
MPARRHGLILARGTRSGETPMTGGSALYLLMCLITFGAFLWVLARVSAQQDRAKSDAAPRADTEPAKTA